MELLYSSGVFSATKPSSLQNPTFNFGLNFDDDADELPTQRLLMRINKTHFSNTGNTAWKCFSATEVSEENPDCSKNPISALIIPVDRQKLLL